jgi:hypothetical protein
VRPDGGDAVQRGGQLRARGHRLSHAGDLVEHRLVGRAVELQADGRGRPHEVLVGIRLLADARLQPVGLEGQLR